MHVRMPRLCGGIFFCVILATGLAGSGCDFPSGAEGGGEGPAHRAQKLALSPEQELEIGRQAYKKVLSNPSEYGRVVPASRPESQRVRGIAKRIIQAAGIEPLQREINLRKGYRFEWEVTVLDKDQVNAFCLPGGKIAVFQGIIRMAQNDDQIATVIAHEISHALAHHTSERAAREMNQGGLGVIWNKAFDREEEAEADHIGLFLMTFAGFDPEEAVRFWERMQQAGGGQQRLPEILSDHPSDAHRIQKMKDWVPKAKAAKRAFDEGRIAPAPGR
ncbi:MAG TPA: M48 family metallopeptidase [Gemmataceae bacterium]|jgi:predicted Zn-dependent protease|nr:M48 family metallopeptidase [Gemmataceae bacterium]